MLTVFDILDSAFAFALDSSPQGETLSRQRWTFARSELDDFSPVTSTEIESCWKAATWRRIL